MNQRIILAGSIALATGALLAVAVPLSASAHVTITPNTAPPSSYSVITFKVPTESATAVTTKLEVDLPTDTPFPSVSYVPVEGWTTQVISSTLPKPVKVPGNEITEAVTKIVWTAQPGFEIKQNQLQLFPVSFNGVPNTGKVAFTALQTYSDGSVVSWSQTSANAEHPAPTLYITDAPPAAGTTTASAAPSPATAASDSPSSDVIARGLGVAGLVLGAIGVVLAVTLGRRRTVTP